jgi:hypothetical protein
MTGPQDPAAGHDWLPAGRSDCEQVIKALKDAFVHGRLTRDEFDMRVGRALAAPSYADLAALTADIPAQWAAAGPARPPATHRRPLARAAAGSGGCLIIAFAAVKLINLADPGTGATPGSIPKSLIGPLFLVAFAAVVAALCILGHGVAASIEQRRSRKQPPRPGPPHRAIGLRVGGRADGTFPPGRAGHRAAPEFLGETGLSEVLADTAQNFIADGVYLLPRGILRNQPAEDGSLDGATFRDESNSPRESARVSVLEDHGNALLVFPRHGLDKSQGVPQVVTEPRGNLVLVPGHDDLLDQTHGRLCRRSGKPDHRPAPSCSPLADPVISGGGRVIHAVTWGVTGRPDLMHRCCI